MEIRVTRSEFLGELAPMQGIVERKTTIPVLSHLLLTARGDKLHLAATDLDVSLTSWCDADIKREGGIAVQAKKLVEIIRSLTGEEVLLVQEEPRVLSIRAGKSRFKIHGLAPDDFPTLPDVEEGRRVEIPFAELPPHGRQDPLRRLGRGVALPVERRPAEAQGRLDGDGGDRRPPARPGRGRPRERRRSRTPSWCRARPSRSCSASRGTATLSYGRGEHHLSFGLGRRELICRILEGTFPDYERVIAKDNDKKVMFDRQNLIDAVQRAALMTGDRRARRAPAVRARPGGDLGRQLRPRRGGRGGRLRLRRSASSGWGSTPTTCGSSSPRSRPRRSGWSSRTRTRSASAIRRMVRTPRYLCVIMPMRI